MRRSYFIAQAFLAASVLACGRHTDNTESTDISSPDPTHAAPRPDDNRIDLHATIEVPPEYVSVPGAWVHRSCAHQVPPGSRIDSDGLTVSAAAVTRDGRQIGDGHIIAKYEPCKYPVIHTRPRDFTSQPQPPGDGGSPEQVRDGDAGTRGNPG